MVLSALLSIEIGVKGASAGIRFLWKKIVKCFIYTLDHQ